MSKFVRSPLSPVVAAICLSLPVLSMGCDSTKNTDSDPAEAVMMSPAPAAPGHQVFIDPNTGERREPTAEEKAALNAQNNNNQTATTPPRTWQNEQGAVFMENPTRTNLNATIKEDGSVDTYHSTEPK